MTWQTPDKRTENQIDHFCISRKWKHNLCDVRVKRSADIESDHQLVVATLQMKVCAIRNVHKQLATGKFDVDKLKIPRYQQAMEENISNIIRIKDQERDRNDDVEEQWKFIKDNLTKTCEQVLGLRPKERKEWMTPLTWSLFEERRALKISKHNGKTPLKRNEFDREYKMKCKEVKAACKKDKRVYFDELATQANSAAMKNDTKTVYEITRKLAGNRKPPDRPIKSKDGILLTNVDEQIQRWRMHFMETMSNGPPQTIRPTSDPHIQTPYICPRGTVHAGHQPRYTT